LPFRGFTAFFAVALVDNECGQFAGDFPCVYASRCLECRLYPSDEYDPHSVDAAAAQPADRASERGPAQPGVYERVDLDAPPSIKETLAALTLADELRAMPRVVRRRILTAREPIGPRERQWLLRQGGARDGDRPQTARVPARPRAARSRRVRTGRPPPDDPSDSDSDDLAAGTAA
jgi:hypothetical protein